MASKTKALRKISAADFSNEGMRGANFVETWQPLPAEDYFNELQKLGANHARIGIHPAWDGKTYSISKNQFKVLDAALTLLQRRKMYAVIVLGLPRDIEPWFSRQQAVSFTALWITLARRYKGRTVIAAFDLLNEPQPPDSIENQQRHNLWETIALACVKAINAVDSARVVVYECLAGYPLWFGYMRPLPSKNVVYSFHSWFPHDFTHQNVPNGALGGSYDVDKEKPYNRVFARQLKDALEIVCNWKEKYLLPIYAGEFGSPNWAPGHLQYIQDNLNVFKKTGISWAFHAWRSWPGWDIEVVPDGRNPQRRTNQTPGYSLLKTAFEV